MFNQELLSQLAQELDQSEKTRVQIEHFSKRHPGMTVDDGYRVAREWVRLQTAAGRKIIGHTPNLLAAMVRFEQHAVGAVHGHEIHEQIAYVLAGAFEVEVEGEKRILRTGDAFVVPRNTQHGVVALEPDSRLLDMFSPRRDDFI